MGNDRRGDFRVEGSYYTFLLFWQWAKKGKDAVACLVLVTVEVDIEVDW